MGLKSSFFNLSCEGQQTANHALASMELGFYTECSEEQYILWLPKWEKKRADLHSIFPNFTHHPPAFGYL